MTADRPPTRRDPGAPLPGFELARRGEAAITASELEVALEVAHAAEVRFSFALPADAVVAFRSRVQDAAQGRVVWSDAG